MREATGGKIFSDVLFAVQWGKQFLRMLKDDGLEGHYHLYLKEFPIRVLPRAALEPPLPGPPPIVPPEPAARQQRVVQDHAEQIKISVGGRIADGVAIWRAVESGAHDSWIDSEPGGDKAELKAIADNVCGCLFQEIQATFHSAG